MSNRMEIPGRKYITTGTASRECGVSKSTILKWIKQGRLQTLCLPSGHYRIDKAAFEKFLSTLTVKG